MRERTLSIDQAVKWGWQKTKDHLGILIGVQIFSLAVSSIFNWISGSSPVSENTAILVIVSVLSFIVSLIISMGFINIAIKIKNNEKPEFSDLFSSYPLFFDYLLGTLLYGVIVLAGLILFIVPGIYWAVKYRFFPYYIIEKKMGVLEAFRASAASTLNFKWGLIGLSFVLFLISGVGLLALVIGLLVAIPVGWLASVYAYDKLSVEN